MFNNIPEVKLGLIAVSRDCFVISLSERRRAAVAAAYEKLGGEIYECKVSCYGIPTKKKKSGEESCPFSFVKISETGKNRMKSHKILAVPV